MKVEPPAGDELTELLTVVKVRILSEAADTRQQRKRRGLAGFIVAGTALLVIGGAGTALATNLTSGVFHPIPHSTHRPTDPPQPVFKPGADNEITPEQAPLDQLWALAKSELDESGGAPGVGAGMNDFAAAVATRCYPQLSAADAAGLQALRTSYQSATPEAAINPARAYFERATQLCM